MRRTPRLSKVAIAGSLLAGLVLAAGCQSDKAPASATKVASPVATTPAATASVAPSNPTRAPATPRPKPSVAHTTSSQRGDTVLAGGIVLPNRSLTPGATNPAVTPADIRQTICRTGYTTTIRPSTSYTTPLKQRQLAAGYSYRRDLSTSDYEEDHLISLELGGSPTSVKNLWPEPYAASGGARVKDKIENKLHDLVCAGQLALRTAQQAIASNWWAAYQRYGGASATTVWLGSYPTAAPSATARTVTSSTGCTRTSSGNCIKGGQFCPASANGQYGYDATGRRFICRDRHWETP